MFAGRGRFFINENYFTASRTGEMGTTAAVFKDKNNEDSCKINK